MESRSYCTDCGAVQAHHLSLWFASTGDVLFSSSLPKRLPFQTLLAQIGEWAVSLLGHAAFWLAKALRLVSLSDDAEQTTSRRSKLLWLEAKKRGIEMEQLFFLGNPTDTFRVKAGSRYQFFKSLPLLPTSEALQMDDKVLFKKKMRTAGLPVPKSYSVKSMRAAVRALNELSCVCVKPRTGSNGRHTYTHVRTEDALRKALQGVRQICAFASVEEHLEGNLCRATCVDGTLVGFLESHYPTIVGDGSSTIAELIAVKNEQRPEGVSEVVIDDSLEGNITRRGFDLDTVLPEGYTLPLTYRAGAGSGGSNREHGRSIHPSFIEPIEKAAKLTGLHIVGFDIIIPNPQLPAHEQRWGFIEANSLPWIDLHAGPFYGDPIDVSPYVWDLWLKRNP